MKQLILIRQSSPLRKISEEEAVSVLSNEEQKLERHHVEIDMTGFADSIEQGDWAGQDQFLREQAAVIRKDANDWGDVEVHYLGLAEVAHMIALGAHLGDERVIHFHDFDRDAGAWRWPADAATLALTTIGEHELSSVLKARGAAVIRVAISAVISDSDVRDVVGDATLADVTITQADQTKISVTRVRSIEDVELIRKEFRRVFAQVRNMRPNLDAIHLFVAAPPSVCVAVGQELTLRNSPPIQLYRYRKSADRPPQQSALLLTAVGEQLVLAPLSSDEIHLAAKIRTEVWPRALSDLKNYVVNKRQDNAAAGRWYATLQPKEISQAAPFPDLPPLPSFMPENATVDPTPFSLDYGFDKTKAQWRLGDRFLLGFHRAVDGDDERLRQLIRLFLFHEYLHQYHSITKNTADEVGKFANCLEYLDYTADTYAILHQLDLSRYGDVSLLEPENARRFLADQVELALKSFWAFDVTTGDEWQVRRIRRYLNWYWRLVQLEHGKSLAAAAFLFRRQPHLEIGGLYQVARGRRVVALLDRLDSSTHLELAIVLENERFFRISETPNVNLPALIQAFLKGEHESIRQFFRTVYDTAETMGGVQPTVLTNGTLK